MITEAAIFLPVFILSVLTLSFLIKAVWIQISVFEALTDEARKSSVKAYVFENISDHLPQQLQGFAADASDRWIFLQAVRAGLEDRGLDGNSLRIKNYRVTDTKTGNFDEADLIRAELVYDLRLDLPAPVRGIRMSNVIYWRIWNGNDYSGDVFSFDRMAQAERGDIVYIFPNAGSRFHERGCRYVNSYAEKTRATADILKKYGPCPLCIEKEVSAGEIVYIFRYGNSYHREDCNSVEKYVIPMDREDASAKNYMACSVCGG